MQEEKENIKDKKLRTPVAYFVRKTEKIFSCIQIFASLIKDNQYISDLLKKKSIPVLESAVALQSPRTHSLEDSISKLVDELRALEVYLSAVSGARMLSEMNTNVVREEIFDLIDLIEQHRPEILGSLNKEENILVGKDFFSIEQGLRARVFLPETPQNMTGNDLLVARRITSAHDASQAREKIKNDFYNDLYASAQTSLKQPAPPASKGQLLKDKTKKTDDKQKERKIKILSLIQKKDRITITDVVNAISGCSEKTLQRDLLRLVKAGVLKKEGERRWSTYVLS